MTGETSSTERSTDSSFLPLLVGCIEASAMVSKIPPVTQSRRIMQGLNAYSRKWISV